MKNIERFIKEYRLALCEKIFTDKDFNFTIFYKDKICNFENGYRLTFEKTKVQEKEILQEYDLIHEYEDGDYYYRESDLKLILNEKYIITEKLIDSVSDIQNIFEYFSKSKGIIWTDELLEKYKEKWNWHSISENNSIFWNEKRIDKFSKLLDFKKLSDSKNIKFNFSLLNNYENRWDWFKLSSNPTIINELGVEILNHKRIIWKTAPYPPYSYEYGNNLSEIRPCICTNSGIEWNLDLFELHKEKIDFWLLAYFGKLHNDIIVKYGTELDENRVVYTNFTKSSDWKDHHPWYRNGWENIFLNPNFYFDEQIEYSLREYGDYGKIKEIDLIRFTGNARDGHNEYRVKTPISHLINPERLNYNLEELTYSSHMFSPKLISKTYIHHSIFEKIIKPKLLEDEKLIHKILEKFSYF